MSQITDIYTALEAIAVTTTSGKTPKVYNLEDLPKNADTARLPARLLLPVGNTPGEGREGQFIAIGTSMTVTWQIADLMLWQASEQGIGLPEFAPELVDYAGKYLDAMRTFKCPTSNSALERVTVTPGIYEWPSGSGKFYSGVLCQLEILEHLHG
jgi:hypothetical protein